MVLLENARVDLGNSCEDFCLNYEEFGSFCGDNDTGCENCVANNDGSNECVLLSGISNATHMELISESDIVCYSSLAPFYYHFSVALSTILLDILSSDCLLAH
jgi:hypothetical protein